MQEKHTKILYVIIIFNIHIMKKKQKNEKEELTSLNKTFLDDFSIEELEERLETDPLMIGQLLDIASSDGMQQAEGCCFLCHCKTDE